MKKIYTIGRDAGCDIVIPDNTDVTSRLHATIRVESNDKIYIIDQSRNGTYINGMKMSSNVEIPVSRKDVVSFAHIYNLDWSLVPKHKPNILKVSLVALFILIVLAAIAYGGYIYLNKDKTPEPVNNESDIQLDPTDGEPEVKPDSVIVHDTIIVEKEKPEAKVVEKDTVQVIKQEEEVYDPIY